MSTAPLVNRLGLYLWTTRSEQQREAKAVARQLRLGETDWLAIERGDVLPDDDALVAIGIALGLDPDALRVLRAADHKAQEARDAPSVPVEQLPEVAGIWYVPSALGRGKPMIPVLKTDGDARVAGIFGGPVSGPLRLPAVRTSPAVSVRPPKEKP